MSVGSLTERRVRFTWCAALVLACVTASRSVARDQIEWNPGFAKAGLEKSELLLGELLCAECHQAPDAVRERIASKSAPYLGEVAARVSAAWLREFLVDPQSVKPGSSMPSVLDSVPSDERGEKVEDLVHFLSSLTDRESSTREADVGRIEHGRQLYHRVGCVACHAPQASLADLDEKSYGAGTFDRFFRYREPSVPLGDLATKYHVGELARFLERPHDVRPSGRMPSLGLTPDDATSIAMYLVRRQLEELSDEEIAKAKVPGLKFAYYERGFGRTADFDAAEPKRTGTVPNFSIEGRNRNQNFGFHFEGSIRVDASGRYELRTASDDGSVVRIDGQVVVDNDGHHGTTTKAGAVELKAGDHSIEVRYFNAGGPFAFDISWKVPGADWSPIPDDRLYHIGIPMRPIGDERISPDPERVARGLELFSQLGCASCHRLAENAAVPSAVVAPALASLESGRGCLAEDVPAGAPRYRWSDEQRKQVSSALRDHRRDRAVDDAAKIRREVAVHNCIACHERDGVGGPEEVRSTYFRSTIGQGMGVEGSVPPPLTGAGAKLRADWLETVLVRGGAVRPYMHTRMPQFGERAVGTLAALLSSVDDTAGDESDPRELEVTPSLAKDGRRLVGVDGMSCISCHTYGRFASLGIPALDLATTPARLKKDWFRRWLLEPATIREGTRMPQFWPDGESVRPDVLEGNTDQQIEALWTYLAAGPRARPAKGLQKIGQELLVFDEAVIYRHWIQGVGPRAIAVGYPAGANLGFDAEGVRLALLWQGSFLDAGQHRSGRGTGMISPLGEGVLSAPPGVPFARLESGEAPWPTAVGREAGYRFGGYRLDGDARRPAFLYSFRVGDRTVSVEDSFVDELSSASPSFRREIVLRCDDAPDGLTFRAWAGQSVQRTAGVWLCDEAVRLEIDHDGGGPVVRAGTELLVPLKFRDGEARVVEVIRW